ncbi:MAG TPA: ABC transporter ATP-binding protein [Deltaproteobacteria bacterium]|nr:MAG: ABC transporter ATP-binding protein [Deltaproteobacteria bacterium GWA2_45_12]HBF11800.1 ABC transporter ATP-binding protein [Deltaproteobacteria bacterium]
MALIEFKDVSKRFGKKEVLKNLNLSVKPGETLTIIGGSGTGKSLTLKLLLGLMEPDSGHVLFKGVDVTQMQDEELMKMRSSVGMLFQGAALFDSLSVYENVAYPIREHFDYPEEKITQIVKIKLELVGLDGIEDLYPSELSGGMKKRVGLARAIATDPEVVLYDEPTAGLDPANTNRIGELITHLQEVLKVTSVVVSHDMEFAFKISNRMALLHNKKIEFIGTVGEVKHSTNSLVQNFILGEIGE